MNSGYNSFSTAVPKFSTELRERIDKLPSDLTSYYKYFSIPKRKGRGFRKICAPSNELKSIQREISIILQGCISYTPITKYAFGFVKGRSISDNAVRHSPVNQSNILNEQNITVRKYLSQKKSSTISEISLRQRKIYNRNHYFLNVNIKDNDSNAAVTFLKSKALLKTGPKSAVRIDIKDAFNSTDQWMLKSALLAHFLIDENDFNRLLKVSLLNGTLPQGAPTSPVLLNIVLSDFDHYVNNLIINKIAKRFKVNLCYSRYADDITITCSEAKYAKYTIPLVYSVMEVFGYEPNKRKTAVMSTKNGIFINSINVVNSIHHISPSKKARNNVRAMINNIALTTLKDRKRSDINSLIGKISHIMSLDRLHGLKLLKYAINRKVLPFDVKINNTKFGAEIDQWIGQCSLKRAKLFT